MINNNYNKESYMKRAKFYYDFQDKVSNLYDKLDNLCSNVTELSVQTDWSFKDVLEHISLTSHYLLITAENKMYNKIIKNNIVNIELDVSSYPNSFKKIDGIKDSENGWVNPEHHYPTKTIKIKDLRARFKDQKRKIFTMLFDIQFKDLDWTSPKITMSVNNLGKLDIIEWIYFLISHAERHMEILEKRK